MDRQKLNWKLIWAIRHLLAGNKITVKDAFYKSMAPLIPFLLVVLVIFIQLLPVSLGAAAVGLVLTSLFSSQAVITAIFLIIFILLAGWSLYMVSSSIFALYIVTLPNVHPRQALKSAKNLVKGRRWMVIRKLLFVPLVIILAFCIFILPFVWLFSPIAITSFYLLEILILPFFHIYFYSLYRSMI